MHDLSTPRRKIRLDVPLLMLTAHPCIAQRQHELDGRYRNPIIFIAIDILVLMAEIQNLELLVR